MTTSRCSGDYSFVIGAAARLVTVAAARLIIVTIALKSKNYFRKKKKKIKIMTHDFI
jgi:hypothetical protein